jgi:hypothetical protein
MAGAGEANGGNDLLQPVWLVSKSTNRVRLLTKRQRLESPLWLQIQQWVRISAVLLFMCVCSMCGVMTHASCLFRLALYSGLFRLAVCVES